LFWLSADAELWSFHAQVAGRARSQRQLEACAIDVGARSFPATLAGEVFHARVELRPQANTLIARCRTPDTDKLTSAPLHYDVRLRATPSALAQVSMVGDQLVLDARGSRESESEPAPLVQHTWYALLAGATRQQLGSGALLTITAPEKAGSYYFAVQITDALGQSDLARTVFSVAKAPTSTVWSLASEPLRGAVVYGVLPPLFGPSGLADVSANLDELADLGVNVLWLAPLFESPAHDFGYAVSDYLHVRASYGGESALAQLITEAHRRDMRVWLDLPANHTAREHRYFAQAQALGARSHYYTFYARDPAGHATHYFDWEHLPNLDYHQPEVARWMIEVASHWIRDYEVDGFRIDAAWGVRQRSPEYWPRFHAALERLRPDIFLLAEASARDPYYRAHGFDAAYDWTVELGHEAWAGVFSEANGIAARLDHALRETASSAHDPAGILRFLNNNDTGSRFITKHGVELTRVATALLLTLPGLPALYSFDEVGAEFEPYAALSQIRLHNPELREFHKRFIWLRRTHAAFAGVIFEPLPLQSGTEVYAYVRGDTQPVLVVLNFSAHPVVATLPLASGRFASSRWYDLMTGEALESASNHQLTCSLASWQARVLEPGP
jgi:glycosidase